MQRPLRRPLALLAAALSLAACTERRGAATEPEGDAPSATVAAVAAAARPITGAATDYDPLVAAAAGATVVLIGEASHGTHEFYRERARITRRLIEEQGFGAVLVEGDWPEAERVNRWARGLPGDATAEQALSGFVEFPRWMWRNAEVRDFVRWLRTTNDARPAAQDVGFYGMDVYGLHEAADQAATQLASVDAAAAARVRGHYACFEPSRPDPQRYGAGSRGASCESAAAAALEEVTRALGPRPADPARADRWLATLGAARSVVAAEEYFGSLYVGGSESSWNLRDRRMAATVELVAAHVAATSGRPGRVVVWAHNSHVGDARATSAATAGEVTLGQLVRERLGAGSLLVGALTYDGQVLAAEEWGRPGRVFDVRPAVRRSWAGLFHQTGHANFLLMLRGDATLAPALSTTRLERAIGVVYLPASELQSHYFDARLAEQFDAVLYFDRTGPVTPLSP